MLTALGIVLLLMAAVAGFFTLVTFRLCESPESRVFGCWTLALTCALAFLTGVILL